MNKVALIGATGNAGSRVLSELERRKYSVTAIVRDVARVPSGPGVTAKSADVGDVRALTSAIAGNEILISSLLFEASDPAKLIRAAEDSGAHFLQMLRETADLDWTFISPSAEFVVGDRTGVFRLGADSLLFDASALTKFTELWQR